MKLLKSIILMAALLAGAGAARAALDFPEVPTLKPGTSATLTVGAGTAEGATALQFTMTLPEGIALGSTTVNLNKERATDHTYRLNKVAEETYKCVIYSNANTPFKGTSGNLFSITLKPASTATKGDYSLKFTDILTADAAGKETGMPDATATMPLIIPAKSVKVDPESVDILVGDDFKLSASVLPAEASQEVVWSSSNEAKVMVAADGTVHGVATGYAYITATTTDGTGRSARCRVNVSKVAVASITLSASSMNIHLGQTRKLTATVLPATAAQDVEWSSSNTAVATVDAADRVTAVKAGEAVITATSTDGTAMHGECRVKVLPPLATSIDMDEEMTIEVHDYVQLFASVLPAEASQELAWTSSAPEIATVDDSGFVHGMSTGTAVITATATDGSGVSAACAVSVEPALVSSIELDRTEAVLRPGETITITATALPDYAGDRTVSWKSANDAVATVDNNGKVVATGVGSTIITAVANDGSGVTAYCAIDVLAPLAVSITLDSDVIDLETGQTATLTATILPAEADQTVEFISRAPAVASVDENGTVTALTEGFAVIIARTVDGSDLDAVCIVNVKEKSGINEVDADAVAVAARAGEIIVSGAPADAEIRVTDASGAVVYSGREHRITGLVPGFHIVIVGPQAFKVIL